jgi:hypothetical protein
MSPALDPSWSGLARARRDGRAAEGGSGLESQGFSQSHAAR